MRRQLALLALLHGRQRLGGARFRHVQNLDEVGQIAKQVGIHALMIEHDYELNIEELGGLDDRIVAISGEGGVRSLRMRALVLTSRLYSKPPCR